MRTLFFDCSMGAAGDMLTAALVELLADPDSFLSELNHLNIPGVQWIREPSVKCGITGTKIRVLVNGEEEASGHEEHDSEHHGEHHHHEEHHHHAEHHHHSSLHNIEHIVSHLTIPEKVRKDIVAVYRLIADAESHVHGVPVNDIHFHEVGTMDAVADVTAVCLLIHRLAPDRIVSSPVHTGSGQVRCAHGILPVPAPATAWILRDVPVYSSDIRGELCTPTGAALLKYFTDEFGSMPVMRPLSIGYGMGTKDFKAANCVRAILGEAEDRKTDIVLELSCNVDDMTAEEISFAMDRLFDAGAREVYTIPVGMKKNRPGTLIRAMCTESVREQVLQTFFRHTTTIGVRETLTRRYIMERSIDSVDTPYGSVRRKHSSGYGAGKWKYEYDDLSKIAKEQDLTIREVIRLCGEE